MPPKAATTADTPYSGRFYRYQHRLILVPPQDYRCRELIERLTQGTQVLGRQKKWLCHKGKHTEVFSTTSVAVEKERYLVA